MKRRVFEKVFILFEKWKHVLLSMTNIFLLPVLFQGLSGVRALLFQYISGCSRKYKFSSFVSSFESDIYAVIGIGDDVEIVFDDEDGIPFLDETVEDQEEFLDVREMESGGRFVEDVNGFGSRSFGEIECELDSLCLSARKSRSGLPELYVPEPDIVQNFEYPFDARKCREKFECFLDGHMENFSDGFSFEPNLQSFRIVPASSTGFTFYVDIREEVHLDLLDSGSFAGLTASALGIEAESPHPVSSFLCFKRCSEYFANVCKEPRISGDVGVGGTTDGRLVY